MERHLYAFGYCSMIPLMPSFVTNSKSYRSSNFKNVFYSLFFKHLVSETRPPKSFAFKAILNTVLQSYEWSPFSRAQVVNVISEKFTRTTCLPKRTPEISIENRIAWPASTYIR